MFVCLCVSVCVVVCVCVCPESYKATILVKNMNMMKTIFRFLVRFILSSTYFGTNSVYDFFDTIL